MKNRASKKIALKTETLRHLQQTSLQQVGGGTSMTNPSLWSDCCPKTKLNCTLGCEQ